MVVLQILYSLRILTLRLCAAEPCQNKIIGTVSQCRDRPMLLRCKIYEGKPLLAAEDGAKAMQPSKDDVIRNVLEYGNSFKLFHRCNAIIL